MKRNLFIIAISFLAEAGAWAITLAGYILFSKGDLLPGMTLAAVLSAAAGLLVWMVLEENLKGRRRGHGN